MRALSATLEAAQRTLSARPAVRLVVDDRNCGAPRYHFARVRQDGTVPHHHAAACCWGGYLGFLQASAIGVPTFYRFAAGAEPGTPLVVGLGGTVPVGAQVALVEEGGVLYAFSARADLRSVQVCSSADGGATWGGWALVHDFGAGATVEGLAAAPGRGTLCTWVLLVAVGTAGGVVVQELHRVGGVVSGPYAWTRVAAAEARGLAAVFAQGAAGSYTSVRFFLAGRAEGETAGRGLYHYSVQVSAFRLWTYSGKLIAGDAPGFSWAWPSACEVPGDRVHVLAQETSPSGATYPVLLSMLPVSWTHPPVALRRPRPPVGAATLGLAAGPSGLHAGHPGAIYHAAGYDSSRRADLSAYVVSYDLWEPLFPWASWRMGEVVLGSEADYLAGPEYLDLGAMLTLEEGYVTAAGAEYSPAPQVHVGRMSRDAHTVRLGVYDCLGRLDRQPADFTHTYNTSLANFLAFTVGLVGLPYGDDGSPLLYPGPGHGMTPTLTLRGSEPLTALLRRVLTYTGTAMIFRPQASTLGSYPAVEAYAFTPAAASAGAYAFGPGGHPLVAWEVGEGEAASWFVALHAGEYAEVIDHELVERLGFARQRAHEEPLADPFTPAEVAGLLAARHAAEAGAGSITVRPHVGAEPGDVVHVEAAPVSGYRRVLGIRRRYARRGQVYEHTYVLGGV